VNNSQKPQCPICGSKEPEYLFSKHQYKLWRCRNCRTGFINPLPEAKVLADVYEQHTYHSGDRYDVADKSGGSYSSLWEKRLEIIGKQSKNRGTLLDVGCATGAFLNVARTAGWKVKGLELSKRAVEVGRKVLGQDVIENQDLLAYKTDHRYQVITAWALLEHVTDPVQYVKKIYELLDENGVFALSTPNISSFSFKRWRERWRYFIPPEHLFYFDQKSLEYLLQSNGFRIVYKRTYFNFLAFLKPDSITIKRYSRNRFFRLFIKLLFLPIQLWSHLNHKGETLEIYAKKMNAAKHLLMRTDKLAQKSKSYPKLIFYRLKHD